ncbi:hypothetical protein [Halocola ammonii]
MNRVLVFKTSVETFEEVRKLHPALQRLVGSEPWNFDLEDCDRILRVESPYIGSGSVIETLSAHGFHCEELAD